MVFHTGLFRNVFLQGLKHVKFHSWNFFILLLSAGERTGPGGLSTAVLSREAEQQHQAQCQTYTVTTGVYYTPGLNYISLIKRI